MSKYEPLNRFLKSQTRTHIPMTFGEIERLLGAKLPPSKSHRAWWSNNPSNNVMTKEWLSAGYETESVDVSGEKLVFRRVGRPVSGTGSDGQGSVGGKRRSLLFGCMKGTLTLDPDLDLTEPSDPELAGYIDRKYGKQ